MNATLISIIRTGVPYLVGLVVSWVATLGIHVPDDVKMQLTGAGVFVVGTIYYAVVRKLEQKWPAVGWLLGSPSQPFYESRKPAPVHPDAARLPVPPAPKP